jgi:predicted acetyltransferase
MRIVSLEDRHKQAIRSYVAEFDRAGEDIPGWFADRAWGWADTVMRVNGWAEGRYLKEGWTPCTSLFLENEGAVLGNVNIRHELNDSLRRYGGHVGYSVRPSARRQGHAGRLLEAGLALLRKRGESSALLTVSPENVASMKVIVRAGGILKEEYFHEAMKRDVCLLTIAL